MTLPAAPIRRMFINGDWADATDSDTMPVINPATEETIADVPRGTEADVDRAVAAARAAFEEWSQTTPGERSMMLWRWAQAIEDSAAELSRLESQNVGKPKGVADFAPEFGFDILPFFAGAARVRGGWAGGEYGTGGTSRVGGEPVGVI